jgi:hypothetical protein
MTTALDLAGMTTPRNRSTFRRETAPLGIARRRCNLPALPIAVAPRDERLARAVLVVAGFTPVTLIAATAFGVAGLRTLATYVLVPVVAIAAIAVSRQRGLLRLVAFAIAAGVASTALYDLYRFAFLWVGLMHRDPIPHIGVALHLRPAWVFGYTWRYLGNGAGLAVAFCALGMRGVRAGIAYGLFVCSGLLITLVLAPYGQAMLFPLNAATLVMAIGGHVIYGAALGRFTQRRANDMNRFPRIFSSSVAAAICVVTLGTGAAVGSTVLTPAPANALCVAVSRYSNPLLLNPNGVPANGLPNGLPGNGAPSNGLPNGLPGNGAPSNGLPNGLPGNGTPTNGAPGTGC